VQADPQRRASFVVHSAIASFYHKSFPALGSASQGVRLKGNNLVMNENVELARYSDENNEEIIVTVSSYRDMIANKNRNALADFIYGRLHSRYILPFEEYGSINKNGFSMMANYCLLVETLQSFINGWGDSNRQSLLAFKQFFTDNPNFPELENKGQEIYKHIRCGILHQGETTNGWRITRKASVLVDEENKKIDAFLFGERMKKSLESYRDTLKLKEWDSMEWDNFRVKMRKVIENTVV